MLDYYSLFFLNNITKKNYNYNLEFHNHSCKTVASHNNQKLQVLKLNKFKLVSHSFLLEPFIGGDSGEFVF